MYAFIVGLHNIIRWVAVILELIAVTRATMGFWRKKEWTESEKKVGMFFSISIDIQILIGLLLYFVYSDWGLRALITKGTSMVMETGEYRFFAIEHGFYMLLGFLFAHFGTLLPKKVDDHSGKYKRAAFWFCLALLMVIAGIPWDSRPLFPGL